MCVQMQRDFSVRADVERLLTVHADVWRLMCVQMQRDFSVRADAERL